MYRLHEMLIDGVSFISYVCTCMSCYGVMSAWLCCSTACLFGLLLTGSSGPVLNLFAHPLQSVVGSLSDNWLVQGIGWLDLRQSVISSDFCCESSNPSIDRGEQWSELSNRLVISFSQILVIYIGPHLAQAMSPFSSILQQLQQAVRYTHPELLRH